MSRRPQPNKKNKVGPGGQDQTLTKKMNKTSWAELIQAPNKLSSWSTILEFFPWRANMPQGRALGRANEKIKSLFLENQNHRVNRKCCVLRGNVNFLKKRRHIFSFRRRKNALLGNQRVLRHFFATGGH